MAWLGALWLLVKITKKYKYIYYSGQMLMRKQAALILLQAMCARIEKRNGQMLYDIDGPKIHFNVKCTKLHLQ